MRGRLPSRRFPGRGVPLAARAAPECPPCAGEWGGATPSSCRHTHVRVGKRRETAEDCWSAPTVTRRHGDRTHTCLTLPADITPQRHFQKILNSPG